MTMHPQGAPQGSPARRCLALVSSRLGVACALLVATTAACAGKEDVTPTIVVSPGAKERIMVMDRLRHHGAPRRLLPKVTVEEVADAELPAEAAPENESENGTNSSSESPTEDAPGQGDAGGAQP